MNELTLYTNLLQEIKQRIGEAQTRALLTVNAELIRLYWEIGRLIVQRQQQEGWSAGVIPKLALDLKNELPEVKGFSERNLGRMVSFFRAYPEAQPFLPQAVAKTTEPDLIWKIPWGHHALLIEKIKALPTRQWYMQQIITQGWSRNVLALMIDARLHERQGQSTNNFATHLPAPQSDLVQQTLKDPYLFDFLTLEEPFHEREHDSDQPTIGLILCQEKNAVVAEYALRGMNKPIGVSEYELTRALPDELKSSLPTIEELEAELSGPANAGSNPEETSQ